MPVLVQPTEVASHRGEGDVEPLGDLFHAQCTGFDCLEELQNLLSPLRAADIAAACDQFIVGAFVHGGGSGALPVASLLVFAHGYRRYMRDVCKSTLYAQIEHLSCASRSMDVDMCAHKRVIDHYLTT